MSDILRPLIGTAAERPLSRAEAQTAFEALFECAGTPAQMGGFLMALRARYAQPVTERGYSAYVPGHETPFENALISTMAQIYPEDRGTNYAIREGRAIARALAEG